MSLLIKGMEMPKAGETIIIAENIVDGTIYGRLEHGDDWYPLIEVPTPHGRLIDTGKLEVHNGWLSEAEGYSTHITFVYSNAINLAPTVIEAEE